MWKYLYNKFAKTYSEKMWGINDNDDLDGEEFGPGLKPVNGMDNTT